MTTRATCSRKPLIEVGMVILLCVGVGGCLSAPVFVQDIDSFARNAVTVKLPYTVPNGKRFDMVYVSWLATPGSFGGMDFTSSGSSLTIYLTHPTPGGGTPMRAVADANTVVSAVVNGYTGAFFVTGALINYP